MDRAVIFYKDQLWMEHKEDIFNVRFDAQIIPSGSVVCGFLVIQDSQPSAIVEVLSPPCFNNPGQEASWEKILAEVRKALHDAIYPP